MPELPPDDPVTSRPMAGIILISAFLLMLTVGWSLYDEFFGLRPWRSYQTQFSKAYTTYLDKQYLYFHPQFLNVRANHCV